MQPLVLSPKAWTCMPRSALASWPVMFHEMVVLDDSSACSKVTVPLTLESPRRTATIFPLAHDSWGSALPALYTDWTWLHSTWGAGAIKVSGGGGSHWSIAARNTPTSFWADNRVLGRFEDSPIDLLQRWYRYTANNVLNLTHPDDPTFPQRSKTVQRSRVDVPALTIVTCGGCLMGLGRFSV